MKKLKVLLWHWGRRGGGPRYTLELARELAKDDSLSLHLSLSRQCEIYKDFASLPIPRLDVDTYSNLKTAFMALGRLPFVRHRFWRYIAKENFDVIVCTMSHLWNVPVLLGKRRHTPYLFVLHDAVPHPGENFLLRHYLLRKEVNKAQGIVTLTQHVKNTLISEYRYPETSTWVIPHGVFPYNDSAPKATNTDFRLLFFGRILPYKGLDILLRAHEILLGRGVNVHLHIAGPGDSSPYTELLSKLPNIQLDNRWIAEEEIGDIFSQADLVVLPYREASQSGVIATSYATGVPVLVTPIGGLVEQVKHEISGLISKEASPEALANDIQRLLEDPALLQQCAEGAVREARDTLAWPAIARRFSEAIHCMASRNSKGVS
ncbi:glycosyltransferase family 4 protein [Paludibacterium purpuratum]|uniref:Glycosyltransferase involved in cell wall biosynthesis n=1 Tax=Paludibacterium purpuratum TaxID=1144873 RepID=A0A4R7B1E8_9NEIS|nr:glycosyltransferase family 4 protein [Paludibacterium purpuratum]TDR76716.1 glycosyltransferase involved in cell wall biosynthesis [Paludibacterium purpuratum]